MKRFYKITFLTLVVSAALVSSVHPEDNKFRLKPGARQKICLGCHFDFEEKLKNPFVHTPVRQGCTGCHSPHTSDHDKQLAADTDKICFRCHSGIIPEKALSTHKPVSEGKCVQCHDPHSSKNQFNLRKNGNELCFGCHKEIADKVKNAKFRHNPVEKACTNCHNPHGSANSKSLLKDGVPSLCRNCHKTDMPVFTKQHMNYPVANARCTMCHNPHGSDKAGMLNNTVHPPFANRMCNQCHEGPSSADPLKLKKQGFELCRGCHGNLVNEALGQNKVHFPVFGKKACLNCHTPHASAADKLLQEPMPGLCGRCHADTIKRQEDSPTKHEPIEDGLCTVCHSPHSSNNQFLFNQSNTIELCGICHDWQKHVTHPIGEKLTDPRNKNLTMQCLSCHRAHGTEYKTLIPQPTITDLCVQCHEQFKR